MKKHYQKPVITFLALLAGFILLTCMTSCGSGKPMGTTVSELKQNLVQKKDSVTTTDTNRAIADVLSFYLGQIKTGAGRNCDSLCQGEINRILLNTQMEKQSGENSYKVLYDEKQKLLKIIMNMAATSNTTTTVDKSKEAETSSNVAKEIPVPYVPDFWRYSAYLGWAAGVLIVYWILNKLNGIRLWVTKRFFTLQQPPQ